MISKEIAVNSLHLFTFDYFVNGLRVVPSAATVTFYDNGGAVLVNAAACVIATDGTITYTLSAAVNTAVGLNFKIMNTYVVSSVSTVVYYLYDVVETPIINLVSDDDLFSYLGELRDRVKEKTFVTSSTGSTTSVISLALKSDVRDFTGGYISVWYKDTTNCGATVQHDARITVYDKATGTATFTPAFSTAIPTATNFSIRPSFQATIDNLFNGQVLRDIRNIVGLAAGYIDSSTVSNLTIFKTLETYCYSQAEAVDDKWERRGMRFREMYGDELLKLQSAYDKNGDGLISNSEEKFRNSASFIRIMR